MDLPPVSSSNGRAGLRNLLLRARRACIQSLPTRFFLLLLLALPSCRPAPHQLTITDDLGRQVAVPQHVRRLVTLAPNLTEIVATLGATDRIIGTDDFSNQPPSVRALPKLGGVQPNAELVAALSPDLIIASSSVNTAVLLRTLSPLHVPVFIVRTDRLSDVTRAIRSVGSILEVEARDQIARTFDSGLAARRRVRSRSPRILFLVWTRPLFVAGRDTFVDDLFVLTGATNAVPADVRGWPQYSFEQLLVAPPDIILFPGKSLPEPDLRAFFASDQRWSKIPAIRDERFFGIDEDRFTRPSPGVVEAADQLNSILDRTGWK